MHDLDPNWELVSDAINSTLQFKVRGSYAFSYHLLARPRINWCWSQFNAFLLPLWLLLTGHVLYMQCIYRKPNECKERHKILMDRTTGDGADSGEDSGSSQPYPSTLPGIPKVQLSLTSIASLSSRFYQVNQYNLINTCRDVPDSCFSVCRDQWKRIHSNLILRRSSWLWKNIFFGSLRYAPHKHLCINCLVG